MAPANGKIFCLRRDGYAPKQKVRIENIAHPFSIRHCTPCYNSPYICAMRKLSMEELGRKTVDEFRQSKKVPVVVVLENIRSAYNVGSVFRTSDAFLVEAIYITGYSAKPPHKEIKKTALGAEETVNWKHFPSAKDAIEELRSRKYRILAVEQVQHSMKLHQLEWNGTEKIAVIFGNEVSGVEQSTISLCDGSLEIPQLGMKHSLNIATAAGVTLWELVRSEFKSLKV